MSAKTTDIVTWPRLAEVVARLSRGRGLDSIRIEMGRAGYPIGQGTLKRLRTGETNVQLDSLAKFLEFCGTSLEAEFSSESIPWPFSTITRAEIEALLPAQLEALEQSMRSALDMAAITSQAPTAQRVLTAKLTTETKDIIKSKKGASEK